MCLASTPCLTGLLPLRVAHYERCGPTTMSSEIGSRNMERRLIKFCRMVSVASFPGAKSAPSIAWRTADKSPMCTNTSARTARLSKSSWAGRRWRPRAKSYAGRPLWFTRQQRCPILLARTLPFRAATALSESSLFGEICGEAAAEAPRTTSNRGTRAEWGGGNASHESQPALCAWLTGKLPSWTLGLLSSGMRAQKKQTQDPRTPTTRNQARTSSTRLRWQKVAALALLWEWAQDRSHNRNAHPWTRSCPCRCRDQVLHLPICSDWLFRLTLGAHHNGRLRTRISTAPKFRDVTVPLL